MFALLTKPRGAPPGAKPAWAARHHVGPRDLRVTVEPPVLPQPIRRRAVNRPSRRPQAPRRKDRVHKPAALAAFLSEGRQSSVQNTLSEKHWHAPRRSSSCSIWPIGLWSRNGSHPGALWRRDAQYGSAIYSNKQPYHRTILPGGTKVCSMLMKL